MFRTHLGRIIVMERNAEKLVDSRIPMQYCTERGRFRNSEQTDSDVLLRNALGR